MADPIKPTETVVPIAEKAEQVQAPVKKVTPVTVTERKEAKPAEVVLTHATVMAGAAATPAMKSFYNAVEAYALAMDSKNLVHHEDGVMHQSNLLEAIKMITATDFNSFRRSWGYFIARTKESTAFNVTYVFRFLALWRKSQDEFHAFTAIVNLALNTANMQSRSETKKSVNLEDTLSYYFNDEQKKNIQQFYA